MVFPNTHQGDVIGIDSSTKANVALLPWSIAQQGHFALFENTKMPLQSIRGLLICFHFKDLQLCVGIVRWVIDHVPRWNRDCFGHNGSSIRRKHHWAWCSGSASNLASFIYVSLLIWPTKLPIAIDPGLPGELLPFKEQGFVLGNAHDSDQGCRPSLVGLAAMEVWILYVHSSGAESCLIEATASGWWSLWCGVGRLLLNFRKLL